MVVANVELGAATEAMAGLDCAGVLPGLGSRRHDLETGLFLCRYKTAGEATPDLAGVVVVFLGSKGGVAAATLVDIRQWAEGALPEAAFVNRCSLDPPSEFNGVRLNY